MGFMQHFLLAIAVCFPAMTGWSSTPFVIYDDNESLLQSIITSCEKRLDASYPAQVEGYRTRQVQGEEKRNREQFIFFDRRDTELAYSTSVLFPASTSVDEILATDIDATVITNPFYTANLSISPTNPPLVNQLEKRSGRFYFEVNLAALGRSCQGLQSDFRDFLKQGESQLEREQTNGVDVLVWKWKGVPAWIPSTSQDVYECEFEFDIESELCIREKVISVESGNGTDRTMRFDENGNLQRVDVDWILNGQIQTESAFQVAKIEFQTADKRELCYVSHYGLPEPPFARRSGWFSWWYVAALLGLIGVGFLTRWMRRPA